MIGEDGSTQGIFDVDSGYFIRQKVLVNRRLISEMQAVREV